MSEVVVAHEKHGTFTYETALGLLRLRLDDGFWYYGDALNEANRAISSGDEETAWRFLESRSDHEYEYVERQELGP